MRGAPRALSHSLYCRQWGDVGPSVYPNLVKLVGASILKPCLRPHLDIQNVRAFEWCSDTPLRGGAADGGAGGPDDGRTQAVAWRAAPRSRAERRAAGERLAERALGGAGGAGALAELALRAAHRDGFRAIASSAPRRRLAAEDLPPWPSTLALDAAAVIDSRLRPPSMAGDAAANELTFLHRDRRRRAAVAAVAAVAVPHLQMRWLSSRLSREQSHSRSVAPSRSRSQASASRSRVAAGPQSAAIEP